MVNPADISTTDKERVQKEDKRDSRKIARSLSSWIAIRNDPSLMRSNLSYLKEWTQTSQLLR